MAVPVSVVLVLALATAGAVNTCLAESATFHWRGATASFQDPDNWEHGVVPGSDTALEAISFRQEMGYEETASNTVVPSASVPIGHSIKLPSNGRLLLDTRDGPISFLFQGARSGPTAVYTGNRQTRRNDFMCSANWYIATNDGLKNATRVPCADDRAIFDRTNQYNLWSSQDDIAVKSVSYGSVLHRMCSSLPEKQFASLCPIMQLGDSLECPGATNDAGRCVCRDSCPPPGRSNENREQEREQAEEDTEELMREIVRDFNGSFSPDALGVSVSEVIRLLSDPAARTAFVDDFKLQLAEAWESEPSNVNITRIQATPSGLRLSVQGRLRASVSDFLAPGQSPNDIPADEPFVFDVDENSGREASQVTAVLRSVLASSVIDEAESDVEKRILAAAGNCSVCHDIAQALKLLGESYRNPVDVFTAICANGAATCSVDGILQNSALTKRGQTLTDPQYEGMLANITTLLTGVSLQDAAVQAFLPTALDLLAEQSGLETSREQTVPERVLLQSPLMTVGATRPDIDLFRILDSYNYNSFALHLSRQLSGIFTLDHVPPQHVDAQLRSPVLVTRSRRSADTAAVSTNRRQLYGSYVSLRFSYETLCLPAAIETCAFTRSDIVYSDLVRRINTAIATYRIIDPPCWSIVYGWDVPCLQEEARTAAQQTLASGASNPVGITADYVMQVVACGDLGRSYKSGQCWHTFPNSRAYAVALAQEAVNAVLSTTTTTATAPTSASSTSDAPATTSTSRGGQGTSQGSSVEVLPISLAAVAGVLLVIAVVVIVVLTRRTRGKTSSAAAAAVYSGGKNGPHDRSVVAFENPMYEQGGDDHMDFVDADEDGDPALYDEPAMLSSRQKQNPVYTSNEDLAPSSNDYLDVDVNDDDDDSNAADETTASASQRGASAGDTGVNKNTGVQYDNVDIATEEATYDQPRFSGPPPGPQVSIYATADQCQHRQQQQPSFHSVGDGGGDELYDLPRKVQREVTYETPSADAHDGQQQQPSFHSVGDGGGDELYDLPRKVQREVTYETPSADAHDGQQLQQGVLYDVVAQGGEQEGLYGVLVEGSARNGGDDGEAAVVMSQRKGTERYVDVVGDEEEEEEEEEEK